MTSSPEAVALPNPPNDGITSLQYIEENATSNNNSGAQLLPDFLLGRIIISPSPGYHSENKCNTKSCLETSTNLGTQSFTPYDTITRESSSALSIMESTK